MMRLVHPPLEAVPNVAAPAAVEQEAWPAEVDMILSAMEAAKSAASDRRGSDRVPHQTRAELRLFAHDPLAQPTVLYTRDISPAGIGFITRERLPLGYGGIVTYEQEDGTRIANACTLVRCREAVNGWFEGALHFSN